MFQLVTAYPFVSKTLREVGKPQSEKRSHHCCGVTLQNEGIGYEDLNELIKYPQDLEFTIGIQFYFFLKLYFFCDFYIRNIYNIIELIQIILPNEYEKETWQMTEDEKLKSVPDLKEKGNVFFRKKDYDRAAEMYAKAIGILEQLMLALVFKYFDNNY